MNALSQLVILSLEAWDDVWRRNQLLVAALTDELPDLRVLFVEPPRPALRNLSVKQLPSPTSRPIARLPGVAAFRPVQWIPDRFTPYIPARTGRAVSRAARKLAFDRPVLWINNHSYARFAFGTGWPVVYDITDDWLLADIPGAKRRRAQLDDDLLMRGADAVVVCSPALAASRGSRRDVVLIPNGVDVAHFTTPQARPDDLGARPVALYLGTLHEDRIDVRLCCETADALPDVSFVYVGPDCLQAESRAELGRRPNVRLLGPRPYAVVPGYLQHADVIVIPHAVSPFTESLDPIKARECLAVGTPTVATPVAGFRDLGPPIRTASAAEFPDAIRATLDGRIETAATQKIWTWTDAATDFRAVLEKVQKSVSG